MKKVTSLILICILIFTGCASGKENSNHVKLYYVNPSEDDLVKIDDSRYTVESYNIENAVNAIRNVPPGENVKSMLIGKTKMLSVKNNSGIIDVNLSKAFNSLTVDKKLLTKAAIVQALTIIKGIDGVRFFVEGEPESKKKYDIYTSSSFMVSSDTEKHERQRSEVIFYQLDDGKKRLVRNIQTVSYNDTESIELNTMKELIYGRSIQDSYLKSALPNGTLVYDAKTVEGVCHVKLNNMLANIDSDEKLKLAVYSIVNTLTSIPGIKAVQIYSDNEAGINRKGTLVYNKPIAKNESEDIVVVPKSNN